MITSTVVLRSIPTCLFFFFSSRRRHTRCSRDWSSDVCSSDLDVSSRGVYFYLSKDVKEGSPVEIVLTLPNEITMAGPVRVRCLGRVQRTEPRNEGAVGVVAAIERYEFLRGDEDK